MAVLGLLTVTACSNDDNTSGGDSSIGVPVQSRGIPFSATISAAGAGSRTRALSDPDASDVITATWAKNEQVAMVYKVGSETKVTPATVSDVSDGTDGKAAGTATITATLDGGVTTGTPVTLVYPYSAVETSGDNIGQVKSDVFAHQDGTIAGISANCDLRQATGTITLATSPASLSSNVSMDSQIAIWKLSLKKDASTALDATKLDIYFGGKTASATPASTPTSTLFMAVPAGTTGLTIIASDASGSYIYNKASVTLAASTYYQSEVTLAKQTTRSISDDDVTLTDGDVVTGTGGGNTQLKIADRATVTIKDLNVTTMSGNQRRAAIECLGDATIIINGTNKLKGLWEMSAVYIPSDHTLTIRGGGTLVADNSGAGGAGIGGSYHNDCGNIVIEGGNITAKGGTGAGIGGGDNKHSCGTITIKGGNITATGSSDAAGIGSGKEGSCGTITITGGNITATGGAYAAGIGSGWAENAESTCGDISISGSAQVIATGGNMAAGIGSGLVNRATNTCGNISISGSAQVIATGGESAAGIGSGYADQATNTCGAISISGSAQVTATGGTYAAGIGSGNGYSDVYVSSCGDISITGGTIEATGGDDAAGIGSGWYGKFTSISITKDITRVTATRSNNYWNAPIGKGDNDQGSGAVTFDGVVMHNGTGDASQSNWANWPEDVGPFGGIKVSASDYGSNGKTWTLTPSN